MLRLEYDYKDERLKIDDTPALIPEAVTYIAEENDLEMHYSFEKGALADFNWISSDLFLDGVDISTFWIYLREGEDGPQFRLRFALLPQVSARLRLPLDAVNQSRWQTGREAAYMKPSCGGDIVDLKKVDRMIFKFGAKGDSAARFSMTPFACTVDEPPMLTSPILPQGPLCDELGQSTIREWPSKTTSIEEMVKRLEQQLADAPGHQYPETFSKYGGWKELKFEATGFFSIKEDNGRWWFVDPEGYAFWSMGIDCIRPGIDSFVTGLETAYKWLPEKDGECGEFWKTRELPQGTVDFFNFLGASFYKTFGDTWHDKWAEIVLSMLRRFRMNTVANWSEWQIAKGNTPYVRPLDKAAFDKVPKAFRDLCDVFDPTFAEACDEYAQQLVETKDDPYFLGYFLMNEPHWGFAAMTPAEGMLFNCEHGQCRVEFSKWLQEKYDTNDALAAAWEIETDFEAVSDGEWTLKVSAEQARQDFEAFSSIMVDKLFTMMTDACKKVDSNHLNLGARYYTIPPEWAITGMKQFDVFSINGYKHDFPAELISQIYEAVQVPVIIGEWHFGALDVGLPGNSLRAVKDQADRGTAYRIYAEGGLAHPQCIGIHYFKFYDQSPMGRFDGENWNMGFIDNCHYPYKEHEAAVVATNEQMYQVAAGQVKPFEAEIEYLVPNTL